MSIPKDPEKFKKWFEKQTPKTQRKWADPNTREALYGNLKRTSPKGSGSPVWKGGNIAKITAHKWIYDIKPKPASCPHCNEYKKLECCNLNGTYNRDPDNYIWLCTKCHRKMDGHAYKKMKEKTRHGLFFNQYYQALSPLFLDF